jgi:hypothetical protein
MAGVDVRKKIKLDPKLMAILDAVSRPKNYNLTDEQMAFVTYARESGISWDNIIKLANENGVGDWSRNALRRRWTEKNDHCS